MASYILRRVLLTIPLMAIVALFVFSLLYIAPGDPAAVIAGDQASPADVERIRESLGLDRPFLVQFGTWSWRILHFDLGTSIFTNLPVTSLIAQRIEPTLSLMALSLVLAIFVAVPLGVLAAWKAGSFADRAIMAFAVLAFSLPVFVVGYLLAYVFALELEWLPVQGYSPLANGFWPWLQNLILPAVALGDVYIALIARITRASMLEVLQQDYIRTARAKGLGQRNILFVHALKNAAVPIVTVIGIGVALLIGGAVVTESVFAIPGLGRLTVDAILRRDYPVIQGIVLMFSFLYALVNLLVSATSSAPVPPGLVVAPQLPDLLLPVKVHRGVFGFLRNNPTVAIGGLLLLGLVLIAIFAPYLGTVDPTALAPAKRTRPPSADFWFGTDALGRDVYSRVLYGTRVSLTVGLSVAVLATLAGLAVGLVSGFIRWADTIIMRFMDGLMSIPPILLAVALMALTRGSVGNVIMAITIAEIPRVSRLVRGVVLSLREQAYVDAAVASGTRTPMIILRHILPNTLAPILVQATYVCASAMIVESILSFIGAGTPPTIPSWGNIMAEGRALWQVKPFIVFFPAAFLSVTVLAVNLLGDGLRDALDPRMAKGL